MNFLLAVLLSTYLAFAGEPSPNFRPCSSSAPVGEIVPRYRIERELRRFVTNDLRIITMDSDFGCLPEPEVRDLIEKVLFTFDNTYITEARDCDDLALEFIVKFRELSRETMDGVPLAVPCGLVDVKLVRDIPEMGYELEGRVGYHAIVAVRCMDGKWLLIDPDTKRVSEFTQHLYEGTMELRRAIF